MKFLEYCKDLKEYWWVIIIFLLGIFINGIKALCFLNHQDYLKNKTQLPHHTNNIKLNEDN